jgi:nucleoside-diphosphate-sugar epimerase
MRSDCGMNIFLAGATGVIGTPLVRLLRAAGHTVIGATRSASKVDSLEALGARAVVVDVFDPAALRDAVLAAKPDVVINQLTDLPDARDPAQLAASRAGNARVRIEGTRNLMAAARAAGARRAIAQSIAFAYAPGTPPLRETDPLDDSEEQRVTVEGVRAIEQQTLNTPGIEGVVLRYGRLYGPGTWFDKPEGKGALSTDAAAHAAFLALTRGAPGIYNVAEDDGVLSIEKARRELGFDPGFRMPREA